VDARLTTLYYLVSLLALVTLCAILPAVILHLLMRAFKKRPFMQVKNYAGRTVALGLGFIWPLWGFGSLVFSAGIGLWYLSMFFRSSNSTSAPPLGVLPSFVIAASVVFVFGLIDDLKGSGTSRGFKGHLKALAHGQVTTGAVKLFGIGITALLFARYSVLTPSMMRISLVVWLLTILLMAGSIALSANFVNLCDLRPGRASKVSILMLVIGLVVGVGQVLSSDVGALRTSYLITEIFQFFVFLLPVLATLRLDLRERGMLGDAGANPSGFIAGAYIATHLGLIGLIVFFLIMLALNLASEKFSFTHVIERNPLLSRLDRIGRIKTVETDREEEHTD